MNWYAQGVWWVASVIGINQTVTFTLPENETLTLFINNQSVSSQECTISSENAEIKAISVWLKQNSEKWLATIETNVPSVVITGSNFSLNFVGNTLILNYPAGQYSHSINTSLYASLHCRNGT